MSVFTPSVQRLQGDLRLHAAFRQIHQAGPRGIAMATAEMLDQIGADSSALDFILDWSLRLNPKTIRWLGGNDFYRPRLRLVGDA